ncbi:MAG: DEAD/DEAH box helicase [Thaumarchaeota archaeon]|nr:DEAD/DEAH box helicase [Nitrososphaerota archaeon]
MNYYKFRNRYAIVRQIPKSKASIVVGFKNQDELKQKFERIAFTVKSEDVLQLPEQIFMERFFELKGENKKGYKRLLNRKEEIKGGGGKPNEFLSLFTRMQQMTSGLDVEMNESYTDRQLAFEDIFDDLEKKEPIVVFARFHYDLDSIKIVADKIGRKSFEFSGRTKQIDQWRENVSDGAILIAQIQTAKEGISLTEAKYAIYYSLPLSLGDYQQILKRLHRPGQERDVTYIHLLAKNTIDEKIMEALKRKTNVTNYLMEDCND